MYTMNLNCNITSDV